MLAFAVAASRADAEQPAPAASDVVPAMEAQSGGVQRRIDDAVEAAEQLIGRGRSEQGLALLRDLLPAAQAHGMDTTRIRFLTAQALIGLRRYEEAAILLAALVSERPAVDRFVLDYAATLFALGRDDDARAVFRNMRSERELPPSCGGTWNGFWNGFARARRCASTLISGCGTTPT